MIFVCQLVYEELRSVGKCCVCVGCVCLGGGVRASVAVHSLKGIELVKAEMKVGDSKREGEQAERVSRGHPLSERDILSWAVILLLC